METYQNKLNLACNKQIKKINLLLIITTLFVVMIKNQIQAQAPDLANANNFAVFTSVGAFTNIGATNVIGDVGTNGGTFTAFPPGILIGQIHVTDSISAKAAIDVNAAYSYLFGLTCDSTLGEILGNNTILSPKTYCLLGASSLNGNLILDAQGDTNALFIFKIDGALTTSTFSNIILINSASFKNVYWQINGVFNLGDSSAFIGNIISNGAINLFEGSTLLGRALSQSGAISLFNNKISIQEGLPLPITLIMFNAKLSNTKKEVHLNWQTSSESNSAFFQIEHSSDGVHFDKTARLNAAGNTTNLSSYFYSDEKPMLGNNYYRLNQFDFNGKHAYSNTLFVNIPCEKKPLKIYPNPFTTSININSSETINAELKICNAVGQEISNTILSERNTTIEATKLPMGIYFYQVTENGSLIQSGTLVSNQ